MKTFRDNQSREWAVMINVDTVRRVRQLLDVDLLNVADGKLFERLVTDPVFLCDCLYAVVKPEADSKIISDEEFGRAMAGDAIEHASTALLEGLVDFFPPRQRQVLAKAMEKLRLVEQSASDKALAILDSPELDKQIEAILNRAGDLSGNLPASSASTPVHSR